MTATADMLIERRRVRRRLAFWRILAIVAVVIALIAVIPRTGPGQQPHIARVTINGMIFHDPAREKLILDLAKDEDVKALIVQIDSPGGTLVGSEALYDAVRKVAAEKPVVAVMSELAASGGYLTALGADHIVARRNTLTGSIGVVMEAPNIEGLLENLGVEVNRIKSAPLKAEPSFTSRPSAEALAAQRVLIQDGYTWFRELVAERRGLKGTALDRVTDGRVFTGGQAVDLGLVDVIGDQQAALDWLYESHGISSEIAVQDRRVKRKDRPWPWRFLEDASAAISQPHRLIDAAPRLYAVLQ